MEQKVSGYENFYFRRRILLRQEETKEKVFEMIKFSILEDFTSSLFCSLIRSQKGIKSVSWSYSLEYIYI